VESGQAPPLMGTLHASAPFARLPAPEPNAPQSNVEIADPPQRDARFSRHEEISNGYATKAS
jgi:hypothetical protein